MQEYPDSDWREACLNNDAPTLKEMVAEGYEAGKYVATNGGYSSLHACLERGNMAAALVIIAAMREQYRNTPEKFIEGVTNTFYDHCSAIELAEQCRHKGIAKLRHAKGDAAMEREGCDALACERALHEGLNEAYRRQSKAYKRQAQYTEEKLETYYKLERGATVKYVEALEKENQSLDENVERLERKIKRLNNVVAERGPQEPDKVKAALDSMRQSYRLFDADERSKPRSR